MSETKEIFPHIFSVHSYLLRIRGTTGLYMESGLFDLLNIAPLNEGTYKRAQLYYDSTLDAYADTDEALMGKISVSRNSITYDPRDEGASESSVGCKEKDLLTQIAMLDIIFTGDLELVGSGTPVFCPDTVGMLKRKRAQSFFPSSAFNAKMRLFVQSVYGSKRTDYTMDLGSGYIGSLQIGDEGVNPYFFSTGYVLYTGSDYQYFMLELTEDQVKVNKLKLSKQGEKLRQWLLDNPQSSTEQRRYEGYLLSTATFSGWYTVGDISEAYAKGSPHAYGWKANWNGDEAHVVVKQLKAGTDNTWEYTHFKLTVSLAESTSNLDYWQDESSWTFNVSEEEATQEATFIVAEQLIWAPDFVEGGMQVFLSQPDAGSTPSAIDCDVPVYIVYNYDDDDFDVIRFKREDLGSGDGSYGGTHTIPIPETLPQCGASDCVWGTTSTGSSEYGFYVENYSGATAVAKKGTGVQISGWEAWLLDDDGVEVGFLKTGPTALSTARNLTCAGEETHPSADGVKNVEIDAKGGSIGAAGDFDVENILVLPYANCDAVFFGVWRRFDGEVDTSRTLPGARVWAAHRFYLGSTPLGELPSRRGWGWNPNPVGPDVRYDLVANAKNDGYWESKANVVTTWDEMDIRYFADGEDYEVHKQNVVSSPDLDNVLFMPACVGINIDALNDPSWAQTTLDYGGYDTHWSPTLFPAAQNAPAVGARGNLTGNFRATKNPNTNTYLDVGEYDYDTLSQYISFVGHD